MRVSSILLLLGVIALVNARAVTWTNGAGNSLWSFAANWDVNAVPTAADDVTLDYVGGASVSISQPAFANSVTIGGGSYPQTLTLLSSLAVGGGGIRIGGRGTLQLQGNNDLPLSSVGSVVAQAGGAVNFASGDITGPGSYTISPGASIVFSGTALKMIEATTLVINGLATIQPSTIQLSRNGTVTNNGQLTAVGSVTIFSNDKSKAAFINNGNFSYQGGSGNTPLIFQVDTYFTRDLNIVSGAVIVREYFLSTASVIVPAGTSFEVGSGLAMKTFATVVGGGLFVAQGVTEIKGIFDVGTVIVTDSGSLTVGGNGSKTFVTALQVSGKLILNSGVNYYASNVKMIAGTVTGSGRLAVSGTFDVAVSPVGNANNFISAHVDLAGSATFTGAVYLLLADAGNLNIGKGVTLKISASAHLVKQSGNPLITNNGQISVALPGGNILDTNVDIVGGGTLDISSGRVTVDSTTFLASSISLGESALLIFDTTLISVMGSVSGRGSLNVTSAPSPASVFGDIALSYFGVPNGVVSVKSVAVNTLELWTGTLSVAAGTANKATIFNFYGGTLQGANASVTSATLNVGGPNPQIIDGVHIFSDKFNLRTVGNGGALMTKNGAQITVGN